MAITNKMSQSLEIRYDENRVYYSNCFILDGQILLRPKWMAPVTLWRQSCIQPRFYHFSLFRLPKKWEKFIKFWKIFAFQPKFSSIFLRFSLEGRNSFHEKLIMVFNFMSRVCEALRFIRSVRRWISLGGSSEPLSFSHLFRLIDSSIWSVF